MPPEVGGLRGWLPLTGDLTNVPPNRDPQPLTISPRPAPPNVRATAHVVVHRRPPNVRATAHVVVHRRPPHVRATAHGNADHQIRLRQDPVVQVTVTKRHRRPSDPDSAPDSPLGRRERPLR